MKTIRFSSGWPVAVFLAGAAWNIAGLSRGEASWMGVLAGGLLPLGPHLPANLPYAAKSLALAGCLLLFCDSTGLGITAWWFGGNPGGAARMLAPLWGYFALSLSFLGVAALGLFTPGVLLAVTALYVLAGVRSLTRVGRDWLAGCAGAWAGIPAAARVILAVAAALCLPVLFLPEVNPDAVAYDLAFPQQLLVTHRLFGVDGYSHWLFPLPAEMPYALAVMAGADAAARWLGMGLLLAGGLAVARALGTGRLSGFIAVAALVVTAQPWFVLTAKNDAYAAGLLLASVALLLESGALARRCPRAGHAAAAGVLLGAAVAAKYVLAPFAGGLAVASLFFAGKGRRLRLAALVAAGAAVPLAPWVAKGFLCLGDPFYPIGSSLLSFLMGDRGTSGVRAVLLEQHVVDPRHGSAALPMVGRILLQDCFPLLAALPLVAALRAGEGKLVWAAAFAVVAGVFGLRGDFGTVERYAYGTLAVLAASGLAALFREGPRPFAAAAVALLAATGLLRLPSHIDGTGGADWVSGRAGTDGYRWRCLPERGAIEPALRELRGRRGNLLAIGELALWDMPLRVRMQVFEPQLAWTASLDAPDERRIAIRFRQEGVRWMLYNQPLAILMAHDQRPYKWTERQLRNYEEFCRKRTSVLAFCGLSGPHWGSSWLIGISDRPRPAAARILFLPGAEAAFTNGVMADQWGDPVSAANWWGLWRSITPSVAWLDACLGNSLLNMGKLEKAYGLLSRAAADGVVDDRNLINLAVVAARTGHRKEALAALKRAEEVYRGWPERLAGARHDVEEALEKGKGR